MKEIFVRKIANEEYDFYPLPQMYLETDSKKIRIKDGEIVKEWSRNVTYFKFKGEALNLPENRIIQHFVESELLHNNCSFISGTIEDGECNEYHILVKNKSASGKKFDFDKTKIRNLRNALLEDTEDSLS